MSLPVMRSSFRLIVAGVVLLVVGTFVIAGAGLARFGLLRSSTRREREPQESDARHGYGDSIVDARTSVDPVIGMRPVNTDPKHH
jgi:hypothetical protein